MNKNTLQFILLTLLALVFSIALMFAFIELPRLLDSLLQSNVGFPGFDHGAGEQEAYKTDLYISSLHLRWIGYGSLFIIVIFIVLGFTTRKRVLAWAGAISLFLPVFGQFALSMFFLAGLGILRVGWLPFMDISMEVLRLGEIAFLPYRLLMWFFNLFDWWAHNFLSYFFMISGALIFTQGVLVWFQARAGKTIVATGWIYRYSRHPQYLGWIIWSYGMVLFSALENDMKKSWGIPSSLPWLLATIIIIGICYLEEIKMKERDGDGYEEYRNRTPFLFPLPGWLKIILKAPMRLVIKTKRPETGRDAALVIVIYMVIFMLLSLPWINFRKNRPAAEQALIENPHRYADSLLAEIRKPQVRRYINYHYKKLEMMGEPAVPYFLQLLGDTNSVVREFAAISLGNLESVAALEPLIESLNDPVWRVCVSSMGALGKIGHESAVEPIIRFHSSHPDAKIDSWTYRTLGSIGSEKAWDLLSAGCNNSEWYDRSGALTALAKINPEKARDYIISALNDEHYGVRRNAVFQILEHKISDSEAALKKMLDDEDYETRFFARQALKMLEE